jgi:hypothetical protein
MSASKFVIVKPQSAFPRKKVNLEDRKETKLGLSPTALPSLRRAGRKGSPGLSLPPEIQVTPMVRNHTFRFYANSSGTYSITATEVIGALGTVCTVTNATVRPFASSFKIKKVSLWSDATSSEQNASITWALATGSQQVDAEKNRAIPAGVSVTGVVSEVPPKGTLCALWQVASSNSIFLISANTGSVIDLTVDYTLSNQIVSNTMSVATGVLGSIYYLYLDGLHLVPVGLPSTL